MMSLQNKYISLKSIFAGIMIGIGGCVFLHCDNRYIGAFLFSFGLLSILNLEGLLYTGRIGFFEFHKDGMGDQILQYTMILCGNMIGALLTGLLTLNLSSTVFLDKLNKSYLELFISSIFCGALMYLAVELYKKKSNSLYVIMPIMIFILCGFDHCIANMYYFAINPVPALQLRTLFFFIINIIGNSIGSIEIRYLLNGKL